jgi:hypothetical protein
MENTSIAALYFHGKALADGLSNFIYFSSQLQLANPLYSQFSDKIPDEYRTMLVKSPGSLRLERA